MIRVITLLSFATIFALFPNFSFAQKIATFRLEPSNVTGKIGDTVTVKVFTKDFTNVSGFQFSIGWDSMFFKNLSTTNSVFNTSNTILKSSSFGNFLNITENNALVAYITTLSPVSIPPSEDSLLFYIKLLIKKDCNEVPICFSKVMEKELIYEDGKGECITKSFPSYNCSQIDFNIEKYYLKSADQNIYFFEYNKEVNATIYASGGVKPYKYFWDGVEGPESKPLLPPQNDTIITIKVEDAKKDTVTCVFNLFNRILIKNQETIILNINDGVKEYELTLNDSYGTGEYSYNWSAFDTIYTQNNKIKFKVPDYDKEYDVNVSDSKNSKKLYHIKIVKLYFKFYNLSRYQYNIDDTIITLQPYFENGVSPFKYLWDNNDTTQISKRKVVTENKFNASVTITDAVGKTIIGSRTFYRDTIAIVNFYSNTYQYNNNYYSFYKNPKSNSTLFYKAKIWVKNKMVYSDSGNTSYNSFYINYVNDSYFDTALIYLTYRLDHKTYPIKDTTIILKLTPKPIQTLNLQTSNYYYCKFDSLLILKPKVSGGIPPYSYNWGSLGGGEGIDWMPVEPTSTTSYSLTVTDKSGQKQVSAFNIYIGVESKIFNVTYEQKTVCPFREIKINIDKSLPFENYNGKQYLVESIYYDKNWNKIESNYYHVDDRKVISYIFDQKSVSENYFTVCKIKSNESKEFCIDKNAKEFVDTLTILPSPGISLSSSAIRDTICDGSVLKVYSPPLDPNNLPNVKYKWTIRESSKFIESDTAISNYIGHSNYVFYPNISNNYFIYNYIYQGVKLTYLSNGCTTLKENKSTLIAPNPKYNLINKSQTINNLSNVIPIDIQTNLKNVNYQISSFNDNLTGSLLEDKNFPLTGNLINNTNKTKQLSIIIKSSLFGCEGQTDTAFITVLSSLEPVYELTESDAVENHNKKGLIHKTDVFGAAFESVLSPNPTSNELNFNFKSENPLASTISIFAISGQKLMEIPFEAQKGYNNVRFSVEKLPIGNYLLFFQNDANTIIEKFVKQ